MTIDATYIDQIVQNVMREMRSRTTVAAASAPVANANLAVTSNSTSLQIAARVVSEDILVAAKAAGRSIALQPGAIVTPSGRDFIRKHNVTITGSSPAKTSVATTGSFIAVGAIPTCQSAASAAGWKVIAAGSEFEAAEVARKTLTAGLVVSCGGEPSVVACLLNRSAEVRAAVITKATNLLTLTTVMSPHVVCLDASGWSFGDILKLLRSLAVVSHAPATWNELPAGGMR
jgi:hypothetical protein